MTSSYFKFKNGYEIGGYWYPRVTAICGILAKPGLLRYYANQENFTKAQESLLHATDWGKTSHEVMGKILKGEKTKVPPAISHSILAFEEWKAQHKISIFDIEKRVFSKEHWYAGTADVFLEIDGKFGVLDLKTSTGIWDEYSLQTAAYFQAFNEMALPKVETSWILRVDQYQKCEICGAKRRTKEKHMRAKGGRENCNHTFGFIQGEYEFKELNNQERDIRAFLAAREIWEWLNQKILVQIENYPKNLKSKFI